MPISKPRNQTIIKWKNRTFLFTKNQDKKTNDSCFIQLFHMNIFMEKRKNHKKFKFPQHTLTTFFLNKPNFKIKSLNFHFLT